MTHRLIASTAIALAALSLTGCDWFGGAGTSADTEMKNVEILPGTASDEMITLDAASGDGTAVDTSVAVGPPVPGEEDAGDDADADSDAADPDTPVSSEGAEPTAQPGDVVIRPPGGRAEGDPPAKK